MSRTKGKRKSAFRTSSGSNKSTKLSKGQIRQPITCLRRNFSKKWLPIATDSLYLSIEENYF
jgi:hypothetical protein